MINPAHPEFASKVHWGLHEPVFWDGRLFNSKRSRVAVVGVA